MSADRRFERALPGILADLGAGPTHDYTQLLAETSRARQRPAWSFPERWLPMDVVLRRPTTLASPPRRLLAVLALLLIAALVGVAILAGSRPTVPPPFGVARNGFIAYVDPDGRIWSGDPETFVSRVIVDTPGNSTPVFSPDGLRMAFIPTATSQVIVTRTDGREPRTIRLTQGGSIGYLGWTPDSRSLILTIQGDSTIYRYDVEQPGEPRVLGATLELAGLDSQPGQLFRPPDAREILQVEQRAGRDIIVVTALDGGARRVVLDDPAFQDVYGTSWSPDGKLISFTASRTDERNPYHTWLMNPDGSGLRRLFHDSTDRVDGHALWSPDATAIAIMRWWNPSPDFPDPRPITIVDPVSGAFHEVGSVHPNGYNQFGWSPDGRWIIQIPGDLPGETNVPHPILVIDAKTGEEADSGWTSRNSLSWQRQAP